MNKMSYNGYTAKIEYSEEDHCFIGHIAGINDVIGFHGDSVSELESAFQEAVEDYLETCKKLGRAPQKTYSGNIILRIPPEMHAKVAVMAEASGESLNAFVKEILNKDLRKTNFLGKKHTKTKRNLLAKNLGNAIKCKENNSK